MSLLNKGDSTTGKTGSMMWIRVWHKTGTRRNLSRMIVTSTETYKTRAPMYCGTISMRYLWMKMMETDRSFSLPLLGVFDQLDISKQEKDSQKQSIGCGTLFGHGLDITSSLLVALDIFCLLSNLKSDKKIFTIAVTSGILVLLVGTSHPTALLNTCTLHPVSEWYRYNDKQIQGKTRISFKCDDGV